MVHGHSWSRITSHFHQSTNWSMVVTCTCSWCQLSYIRDQEPKDPPSQHTDGHLTHSLTHSLTQTLINVYTVENDRALVKFHPTLDQILDDIKLLYCVTYIFRSIALPYSFSTVYTIYTLLQLCSIWHSSVVKCGGREGGEAEHDLLVHFHRWVPSLYWQKTGCVVQTRAGGVWQLRRVERLHNT